MNQSTENFQQAVSEHYRAIRYFFEKRGCDTDTSQDLVQITMMKAYRGLSGFEGRSSLKTWLFMIARNTWLNHIRDRPSELPLEPMDEIRAGSVEDPLIMLLQDEKLYALHQALDNLPPRMKHCVYLKLGQGLKYREVADILQVNVNTVKSHLFQAKKLLKNQLVDYFTNQAKTPSKPGDHHVP